MLKQKEHILREIQYKLDIHYLIYSDIEKNSDIEFLSNFICLAKLFQVESNIDNIFYSFKEIHTFHERRSCSEEGNCFIGIALMRKYKSAICDQVWLCLVLMVLSVDLGTT